MPFNPFARKFNTMVRKISSKNKPSGKPFFIDARIPTNQVSHEIVNGGSTLSLHHRLTALRNKFSSQKKHNEAESNNMSLEIARRMALKLNSRKPIDDEKKALFLQRFTHRLQHIHYTVKIAPFTEHSVSIDSSSLEFVYHHIVGQLFHVNPHYYIENSVQLFNDIQSTIRKALQLLLLEVHDLSLEFQTSRLLKHIHTLLADMIETVVEFGGHMVSFAHSFTDAHNHGKFKPISLY